MASWTKQLDAFYALIEEVFRKRETASSQLRFGCPFIKASDIAQQFFCEKKVEMQHIYGRIETEGKILGTEAHLKLLEDTRKIKREKLWEKIFGKTPVFAHEMFLLAKYKDVILAGIPDSVLFANGMPAIVFEYKFSRSRRIFDSYQVQTRMYGILLRGMGFDISRLFSAVVVAEPRVRGDMKLKTRVVDAVVRNGPKEAVLTVDGAKIFFEKFEGIKAEQDLDWAIEFWRFQREATPTEDAGKCQNCEYASECMKSQNGRAGELTEIPLVGYVRAKAFLELNIKSINHVSNIDPCDPKFNKYSCFSVGYLDLIKNYANAILQNKIIVRRKSRFLDSENIYFFDAEYNPTGTRNGPYGIFLIGVLDEDGKVTQHFLDKPQDEKRILSQFIKWLRKENPTLVSYASTSADKPQLLNALMRHNIPAVELEKAFFDLYYGCINTQRTETQSVFLPMRRSMSLKDVAHGLGYRQCLRLNISDGLQALLAYDKYLKTNDTRLKLDLLQYNKVDLERTKFIFDRIRESNDQASDQLISETDVSQKVATTSAYTQLDENSNIEDFTCPRCRHFHSSNFIKKVQPKRCYRCGHVFRSIEEDKEQRD